MTQGSEPAAPATDCTLLVVIVSWNSGPWLPECLQALAAQPVAGMRTLLWDNGSDAPTLQLLDRLAQQYPDLIIVRSGHNHGFAAGNNRAIAAGPRSRYLLTLNADVTLAPDCLPWMLAALEADASLAAVGALQLRPGGELIDGRGDVLHLSGLAWRDGHGRRLRAGEARVGAADFFSPCAALALYRRSAFDEVQGFDEDFFCYFEDVDLGYRLRLAGWDCRLAPQARAVHVGSASTGAHSDFSVYHGHRNLVWSFVKNTPGGLFWVLLPVHLAMNLAIVAVYAWRGRAGVIWRAKRDALRGLPRAWHKRRMVQAARRAAAASIWRVMRKSPLR